MYALQEHVLAFQSLTAYLYKKNINIGGPTKSVIEQEKLGIDKTEDQATDIYEKLYLQSVDKCEKVEFYKMYLL